MPVLSVTELIAPRTQQDLESEFLVALQDGGFPVTNWPAGGVARTLLKGITTVALEVAQLVRVITSGGFVEFARDLKNADGSEMRGWLNLLAEQVFKLQRAAATYTIQRCELTCNLGTGPYTIAIGQLIVTTPDASKRRYINTESVVVPAGGGGSVSCKFQAESPGSAYNDGAGTLTELVTPLPGLNINNPAPSFGGVDSLGRATPRPTNAGTGTITLSGAPSQSRSFSVEILTSGQVTAGSAKVTISQQSGGTIVKSTTTLSPIPASWAGAGDGVTLTFANGSVNPSFVVGDVYTFATPGTPILQAGADEENNASLAERCLGRWPSLSTIPTEDRIVALVKQCSIDNQLGITKIRVAADAETPGIARVIIATAGGAPSGGTITTVQNYLDARTPMFGKAEVVGAVNQNITIAGSVTVKAAQLTAVQVAADAAWSAYIAGLPIGGDPAGQPPGSGVVRLTELIQAVMDAGAIDCGSPTTMKINGNSTNATLTSDQVAVVSGAPSVSLTWQPVP